MANDLVLESVAYVDPAPLDAQTPSAASDPSSGEASSGHLDASAPEYTQPGRPDVTTLDRSVVETTVPPPAGGELVIATLPGALQATAVSFACAVAHVEPSACAIPPDPGGLDETLVRFRVTETVASSGLAKLAVAS